MRKVIPLFLVGVFLLGFLTFRTPQAGKAQEADRQVRLIGAVFDPQHQPIEGAAVRLIAPGHPNPLAETQTQLDGTFILQIPPVDPGRMTLVIERAHFEPVEMDLSADEMQRLQAGNPLVLPDITLARHIGPAFWIATLIFIFVLVLIAMGRLHNTLATLVGMAVVFSVSYLGPLLREDLFVFDFHRSLSYIDWNVIFLIMGMMIVIAVLERTGIFQWLALFAYRLSRGRPWLLVGILMVITGVVSAFLDNVTTMLLMTPITIQISLALNINPLALLMPEVMASNVVGISTLVGTPTNILIGSFANITFNDFLTNLTPGVLLAFVGLVLYSEWIYKRELANAEEILPMLMEKLEERARITQPDHLKKAGVVGAGMLTLFIFGERVHLLPAVTALIGATALLVWIRPDIEEMIEAVDWTTLVFFMGLFIVVGAIQEVGLIGIIAEIIGRLIGQNLILAIVALTFTSAVLSTVVANIPFTAAILPVIAFLSAQIPGAESKVLFYCLSVGSAMGGNGSLIGASANMVTSGIALRAGYPISYTYFLKKGFPAMLITVSLATVWLLIHFI